MRLKSTNNINPFLYLLIFIYITGVNFPFSLNLTSEFEIIKGFLTLLSFIVKTK